MTRINAAVNHNGGTSGVNSNLYDKRSEDFIPLAVGNWDDAEKFSAKELLEKAGKEREASQAQQTLRVRLNYLATFASFSKKYIFSFRICAADNIQHPAHTV